MGLHQRAYYQRNKEKEKARSKAWRDAHPGYATRKSREFRAANPLYTAVWNDAHRERVRAAGAKHRRKDPAAYRAKKTEQKRAWRAANPGRDELSSHRWREKGLR